MTLQTASIIDLTLAGPAQAFQVRHIATCDAEVCAPEERAVDVLRRLPDFDQIPVREGTRVVGILERGPTALDGLVRRHMHPLHEGLLVTGDTALLEVLPQLAAAPYYRLVVEGTRVAGIVTRSDILKLPVRLLAFALVTGLELLMAEIIRTTADSEDRWLACLSEGRRAKVIAKRDEIARSRMDPDPIEFTEFYDKAKIVRKLCGLPEEYRQTLNQVQLLRNSIAHAADYARTHADLGVFVRRLQMANDLKQTLIDLPRVERCSGPIPARVG